MKNCTSFTLILAFREFTCNLRTIVDFVFHPEAIRKEVFARWDNEFKCTFGHLVSNPARPACSSSTKAGFLPMLMKNIH
jgi:hypothetical protein